ncbi:MAG: orotidine-5'-phosphate decarboxylase, partial [Clostridia bacterium]|nr:orotidine-5'-phosphate decarboxylase [Clostridia bacterium]
CVTVNPYLGTDGVLPFVNDCKTYDKAIFALVKTSNPSSGELQDLITDESYIYEKVAQCVNKWNEGTIGASGYGAVGAVVGATYPRQAIALRRIMKQSYFLVPGYGAQGGGAKDVVPCFNDDGLGAIVNSSRGIMCAYKKGDWKEEQFAEAARAEAIRMRDELVSVIK